MKIAKCKIVAKNCIKPIFNKEISAISYSGAELFFPIDNSIDKVCIEDKKGKLKEIWNKDTEVKSKEEWAHWYIDYYVPQEVKERYNLSYDVIMNKSHIPTMIWRHLYAVNLK